MRAHIAPFVYYLEVHFLYASLLCLAAWALTSMRGPSATCKYWMWVATSIYFAVPLAGFFNGFGAATITWATQLNGLDAIGIGVSHHLTLGGLLAAVWLCGVALMITRLLQRMRAERRDSAHADARPGACRRSFTAQGVPVRFSGSTRSPSVEGFLRPSISLPEGIDRLLSKPELDAVLIHELTHAMRRDNLIGLIHELALCALWFHPLVWLTSFRLALYREMSCDETVIAKAHGTALVTALAKLAQPEEPFLLRARASSFMDLRLARLATARSEEPRKLTAALLAALFGALLLACLFETVAHTGHCFKVAL